MSTDFDLFDSISSTYNKGVGNCSDDECKHNDVVSENGIVLCTDCGEEIDRPILHDKEWRFYGSTDSKRSSDPTRVHVRKNEEKNIDKDVETMGFSQSIVTKANELYMECTKGQIYRGGSRKAIIFACVFHAYKLNGNHQTPDNLIQIFRMTRKEGLKGLKIINVNISKSSDIHNTFITSRHIINDIMNKFTTNDAQKEEVYVLYEKIKNRSSTLNRARPQSVAAAVIYYWISLNKIDIPLSEFANTTHLSELTINKNMKEVERVI